MPRYVFPYYLIDLPPSDPFPEGRTVRRPLMVVALVAPNGSTFECVACPDTGADDCVFPLSFASQLGLDVSQMRCAKATGVGAENDTWYENLTIRMDRGLEIAAYVGFTAGLEDVGYGLLGQSGFFSKYEVLFDHEQSEIVIYTKDLTRPSH
jgi:hypothetical protein